MPQLSQWAYTLNPTKSPNPAWLSDGFPSYRIHWLIKPPDQADWPKNAAQVWQANWVWDLAVATDCTISGSETWLLDMWFIYKKQWSDDLKHPDGYPDRSTRAGRGEPCLVMIMAEKTVGFNPDGEKWPWHYKVVGQEEYESFLSKMRGPKKSIKYWYVYRNLKDKRCCDCELLVSGLLLDEFGTDSFGQETLDISGIGRFPK